MKFKKILTFVLILGFLLGIIVSYSLYNVALKKKTIFFEKEGYLLIPTNSDFKDVVDLLKKYEFIKNEKSFSWLARQKNYIGKVKPGKYLLKSKMSNNDLINLLRSGEQVPVSVRFNNINSINSFAELISQKLELDYKSLLSILEDSVFLATKKLTKSNVLAIFIPNTYEFYWNTNEYDFFDRMLTEYNKFWNDERRKMLKKINSDRGLNLDTLDVSILASIVQEEIIMSSELSTVAGLYINRLDKNMKLQADPTLKFAAKIYAEKNCNCLQNDRLNKYKDVCYEFCVGDSIIRRVLNKHKEINSRYNTYKNYGLPPGPVCFPDIPSIDAVLQYKSHDYLYMCANSNMNGFHIFTKTLQEHQKNARRYQNIISKK